MLKLLGVVLVASQFTQYPAFLKRHTDVEAVTDKGLIFELIVRCDRGVGIMSYSKVEGLYCSPRGGCSRDFASAHARTCG